MQQLGQHDLARLISESVQPLLSTKGCNHNFPLIIVVSFLGLAWGTFGLLRFLRCCLSQLLSLCAYRIAVYVLGSSFRSAFRVNEESSVMRFISQTFRRIKMNHRYCRIIFAGYYTVKFLNELIDLLIKILTLFNYFLPKKQMSFPLWSHRYKSKKGKWIYIPTDECRIKRGEYYKVALYLLAFPVILLSPSKGQSYSRS